MTNSGHFQSPHCKKFWQSCTAQSGPAQHHHFLLDSSLGIPKRSRSRNSTQMDGTRGDALCRVAIGDHQHVMKNRLRVADPPIERSNATAHIVYSCFSACWTLPIHCDQRVFPNTPFRGLDFHRELWCNPVAHRYVAVTRVTQHR